MCVCETRTEQVNHSCEIKLSEDEAAEGGVEQGRSGAGGGGKKNVCRHSCQVLLPMHTAHTRHEILPRCECETKGEMLFGNAWTGADRFGFKRALETQLSEWLSGKVALPKFICAI